MPSGKRNSDVIKFFDKEDFWNEISETTAKNFKIIGIASLITLLVVIYKYLYSFKGYKLVIILSLLSVFILFWIIILILLHIKKSFLIKNYNIIGSIAVIIGSVFISYSCAIDKGFMSQFYLGIIQLEIASVAFLLFKKSYMIVNLVIINSSFYIANSFIPPVFDTTGFINRAIASTVFLIISVTIYWLNFAYKKRDYIARKELKKNEETLLQAKAEMEKANNAKSDFLARMSHELRTPLTAILGFSEILKSEVENEEHKNYLQIMQNSGKNLLHIIDDILDMSKIEAGEIDIRYSAFDLRPLLEDIKKIFVFESESKGIELDFEFSDGEKLIIMDPQRLSQIIINLVGNSLKYTEAGKIILICRIIPQDNDLIDLQITIKDTGRGIPEKYIDKIFNPFFQIGDMQNSKKSGVGLGLAITKLLVERMNGRITVKSKPETGTEFTIKFQSVSTSRKSDIQLNSFDTKTYRCLNNKTILIVEDIPEIRDIIKKFLSGYNMSFIEAENGAQAIERLKEYLPDIIILDIKMPEKGGIETLKEIRNDLKLKDIGILAVSASVFDDERKDIFQAGADGFIPKPINSRDLITELVNCLHKNAKNTVPD